MSAQAQPLLTDAEAFGHALYVLDDWASMMDDITRNDPPMQAEWKPKIDKALRVITWLEDKRSAWETRVAFSGSEHAAKILAAMLIDWSTPGAIYFHPRSKRFRLVGDEYKPAVSEILLGVYLPGATESAILADIDEVNNE